MKNPYLSPIIALVGLSSTLAFSETLSGSQNHLPPTNPNNSIASSDFDELIHLETHINNAILAKDWQALPDLLQHYQTLPEHDPILYQYGMGAIFRHQGKQNDAIAAYKTILTHDPNLSYVKLDLALMLAEDKQYKKADQLLAELQQVPLPNDTLTLIAHFRQAFHTHRRPRPTLSLNYETTDNVNNASSTEQIEWLGRQWQKDDDSLPKSAHGVRYSIGLSKETNVTSNHNLLLSVDGMGVSYWDNPSYNEQSLKASIGYKYQDIDTTISVSPFSEQSWLAGERHLKSVGTSWQYANSLGRNRHWQLYGSYHKKRHQNERTARRYDGRLLTFGTAFNHRLDDDTLLYGGVDTTFDHTLDKELSSARYGLRGGIVQSFGDLTINANARYAYRQFNAPSTLVYPFIRQDHEYQAGLTVWHKKIAWHGIAPQANVRYSKIDSNMPALYSRQGLSYFISFHKDF